MNIFLLQSYEEFCNLPLDRHTVVTQVCQQSEEPDFAASSIRFCLFATRLIVSY